MFYTNNCCDFITSLWGLGERGGLIKGICFLYRKDKIRSGQNRKTKKKRRKFYSRYDQNKSWNWPKRSINEGKEIVGEEREMGKEKEEEKEGEEGSIFGSRNGRREEKN